MPALFLFVFALISQDADVLAGHTREVYSIAVSPDGKLLASGSADKTIRIWDLAKKTCIATLEGHDGDIYALAFSGDGSTLASGDVYKKVKLWAVEGWKETKTLGGMDGPVHGVALSQDGKRLYAACHDNTVRAWNLAGGPPAIAKHDFEVLALALSPNGKFLATGDGSGVVKLWDAATLQPHLTIKHGDKTTSVAFSRDGLKLATGGGDGSVRLWDVATGDSVAAFKTAGIDANALAFGSGLLVVGTQDNLVLFLDAATGAVKAKHEKHERPVTGVAITPDGSLAATASMDYSIRLWRLK